MKRLVRFLCLALTAFGTTISAYAQCTGSTHCATLTWTASPDVPTVSATAGYNVYRLNGVCPSLAPTNVSAAKTAGWVGPLNGTALIQALTYTDNGFPAAPLPLGAYCYFATASLNGAESVPSNIVAAAILPLPPGSVVVSAK